MITLSQQTMIHLFIYCLILHTGITEGKVPGCTGQTFGEQNPTAGGTTAGNTDTSYLLSGPSMSISCCGVVSEWKFAAAAAGDLTAQVWKPSGSSYELVGETLISGVTAGSVVTQAPATPISVETDYLVGWHTGGADIVPKETDVGFTMGVLSSGGKQTLGSTNAWSGTAVDGERWHFGVAVANNSAPYFTGLPTTETALTSDAVGTSIFTVNPTDDDPDDVASLTVSLSSASAAEFQLVGNEVQIASTLSSSAQPYEVVVVVEDHCESKTTATLTVSVTDTGPVIESLPVAAPFELREDTDEEVLLHDIVYSDLDTDLEDIECSIDSTIPTPAPIHIKHKEETYEQGIYFIPDSSNHLDNDQTASFYEVYVVCNDGTADSEIKMFQVDIVPNEPPVPVLTASIDISATNVAGANPYSIAANDPTVRADGSVDTVTFEMSDCSCPLTMTSDGKIYVTEDLNSHRTSPYVVNVTTYDWYKGYNYNKVGPTQMTIHITDINTPPNITYPTETLPNVQTVTISEHTEAEDLGDNLIGTVITAFTADGFDADGDTLTWDMEFVNGRGEILFEYDSATGEIVTAQDLDYETLQDDGLLTTRAYIRAYDGREYSETRTLDIVVTDDNEMPKFQQDTYHISTIEGADVTKLDLQCPLFDVEEEDNYDSHTYYIDCGAAGYFEIENTRTATCDAIIQQVGEYDLDDPGAESEDVTCTVLVRDIGGLEDTATLVITVLAENDNPPVFDPGSYVYTITNDTTPGTTLGSFFTTDEDFVDLHQRHTYHTDSTQFAADPNGVIVSTEDWTDINAPTFRKFNVYATDESGKTDSAEVTVYIEDVPPTTTTTTAPVTIPDTYDAIGSFLDDPGNLAWLIPAILLGLLMLGLMGFMCARCCMTPGACLNSCRGGRCFGRGSRGGRGFFGRRTFVNRFQQPKRVVKQPRPVKVVEKQRPIRVVEKRPIRVIEEPRPVRYIDEPRPVRVVEDQRPAWTTEAKPAPPEPVNEPMKKPASAEPPKKKGGFFDFLKSKPSSAPVSVKPKAVDEPKQFHLWGTEDFKSQQKWVG